MSASSMHDDVAIRLAAAADAGELAELATRTFHDTYAVHNSPQDMATHIARSYGTVIQRAEIDDPAMRTILAIHSATAIGYAQLRLHDARHAKPACVQGWDAMEIWRFYIDRPWHGRGVAQRLMNVATDVAKSLGSTSVWLGVWEKNPRAIAFYRRCGFRHIGEHQFQLADQLQTDLVMARDV